MISFIKRPQQIARGANARTKILMKEFPDAVNNRALNGTHSLTPDPPRNPSRFLLQPIQ